MAFYAGIDLHSKVSQVAVIDSELAVRTNQRVRNELGLILTVLDGFEPRPEVVVESTFNWYWLVDGLQDAGYEVKLAHTLGLSMITKAKVKTDRRDAVSLARLLRMDEVPPAYIHPRETRAVRDLIRQRTTVVSLRSREYCRLRRHLYQLGLHDHSRNSVRQLTEEELGDLIEDPRVRLVARQEIERIDLYSMQIGVLEERIGEWSSEDPAYARLREVPGLGNALAPVVLFEVGNPDRFPNARAFSSYARVVPGAADSGGKTGRGRCSKQGNPHLKLAFSQAAVHAVRYYPKIRACYERQLNRHRGRARKLVCLNIIAHKIALAAYHVLKKGTRYEEKLLFGN